MNSKLLHELIPESAVVIEDWSKLTEEPLVSVRCNTFNHADYIADAIEGILMQKTNFPFEVLIHDDASTDGTAEIIRRYQAENPDLIRAVLQTENQYSQGKKSSRLMAYLSRGKYIAYCEGDDYWTDALKLQKQLDFLITNPDFSMCAHDVNIVDETKDLIIKSSEKNLNRFNNLHVYNFDDLARGSFIHTCSMVIRKDVISNIPEWINQVYGGDYTVQLLAASKGKVKYLNDVMASYRVVQTGLTATTAYSIQKRDKQLLQNKLYLKHFGKAFKPYYYFKIGRLTNTKSNIYIKQNKLIRGYYFKMVSYLYLFHYKITSIIRKSLSRCHEHVIGNGDKNK